MKIKVNPTRMELLKLRKRVQLAKRGHKLLKDKEEQLLIEFRTLVEDVRASRKSIEKDLDDFYMQILKFRGILDEKTWKDMIERRSFKTSFSERTVRTFNIPVFEISLLTSPERIPVDYTASPCLYQLLGNGKKTMQQLLKLSFLENKLISFAYEIERTRRRVNALEYVLIPNLEETIKFITFKLNENERTSLVMLKHIQLVRE